MSLRNNFKHEDIEAEVQWLSTTTDDHKLDHLGLTERNKRLLDTLKKLETHLDRQLEAQKKRVPLHQIDSSIEEQLQEKLNTAEESIKNNEKYISILEKEERKLLERQKNISSGLASKMTEHKIQLEHKIAQAKASIRKYKLEEAEISKTLEGHQDISEPQGSTERARLEQQLRMFSKKYVKFLDKHNKLSNQLAQASNLEAASVVIPNQLYDQQLQEREEAQFKQYQSIIRLATVLSKRNDSENTKNHRIYTDKLKQLEKIILNIAQADRQILAKQGEALERKKHIDLAKNVIGNHEHTNEDLRVLANINTSLQRKSYSTTKLLTGARSEMNRSTQNNKFVQRKFSKM